jgi:cytoskeletal protein CcmA (bactofilin family)
MFATATKEKPKASGSKGPGFNSQDNDTTETTVVSRGSTLEGKFSSTVNVRLDGEVRGDVLVEKRLVVGEDSEIQGNVRASYAAVKGKIRGDIEVKETLHLHATAFIEGNIKAKMLVVDEGARYNGSCLVGNGVKI